MNFRIFILKNTLFCDVIFFFFFFGAVDFALLFSYMNEKSYHYVFPYIPYIYFLLCLSLEAQTKTY